MIAAIVPQFFSLDIEKTLLYYRQHLAFETQFEYGDPTFYAGVIRNGLSIFIRQLDRLPPTPSDKFDYELLDAYLRVEDVRQLHREFSDRNVEMFRDIAEMPWSYTEFVVRDVDDRLLCFGEDTELARAR